MNYAMIARTRRMLAEAREDLSGDTHGYGRLFEAVEQADDALRKILILRGAYFYDTEAQAAAEINDPYPPADEPQ